MIPHIASLIILNIALNSWMAFVTSALLIVGVLGLFRIKNPRYRSLLKTVPILKMPLDLCLISWSNWAILNRVYPWESPEGTRMLAAVVGYMRTWTEAMTFPLTLHIGFVLQEGYSFSVADYVAYYLGNTWLIMLATLFAVATGLRWTVSVIQLWRANKRRKQALAACVPCYRPIDNLLLKRALLAEKITVVVEARAAGSPYLLGCFSQKIVFPELLLNKLDQTEYEAVIAHELEHAAKNDLMVNGIIQVVRHLFWWVPMGWLIRSLHLDQEVACDRRAGDWTNPIYLGAALLKVARQSFFTTPQFGIPLLRRPSLSRRIAALCSPSFFLGVLGASGQSL